MAAKQRRRKTTRRNYRRKAKPKLPPLTGFPNNKLVRLKYVDELRLTTTLGQSSSKSLPYVANGMYDPYYPIGGHAPKGFNQWMAVYSHYNVIGSKIKVTLASSQSNNVAYGVCTTPESQEMNNQTLSYILESRLTNNVRYISWNNNTNMMRNNKPVYASYSQKKVFGSNSAQKTDLTGNIGANPAERQFFEIWAAPIQGDTAIKTLDFVIEIEYLAVLTEPKILIQS